MALLNRELDVLGPSTYGSATEEHLIAIVVYHPIAFDLEDSS